MSKRSVRLLLDDMLEATERIERHVVGLDRSGFLADEKISDAVARNLEILGKAAAHVPDDFKASTPDLESPRIVGLKYRVVHGYFAVDLELVLRIVVATCPASRRDFFEPSGNPSPDSSRANEKAPLAGR